MRLQSGSALPPRPPSNWCAVGVKQGRANHVGKVATGAPSVSRCTLPLGLITEPRDPWGSGKLPDRMLAVPARHRAQFVEDPPFLRSPCRSIAFSHRRTTSRRALMLICSAIGDTDSAPVP